MFLGLREVKVHAAVVRLECLGAESFFEVGQVLGRGDIDAEVSLEAVDLSITTMYYRSCDAFVVAKDGHRVVMRSETEDFS